MPSIEEMNKQLAIEQTSVYVDKPYWFTGDDEFRALQVKAGDSYYIDYENLDPMLRQTAETEVEKILGEAGITFDPNNRNHKAAVEDAYFILYMADDELWAEEYSSRLREGTEAYNLIYPPKPEKED